MLGGNHRKHTERENQNSQKGRKAKGKSQKETRLLWETGILKKL